MPKGLQYKSLFAPSARQVHITRQYICSQWGPVPHKANPDTNIYTFTNPSAQAGYDTRSIFKWSLTGLNSVYSFS